jgi:hypothetical protein
MSSASAPSSSFAEKKPAIITPVQSRRSAESLWDAIQEQWTKALPMSVKFDYGFMALQDETVPDHLIGKPDTPEYLQADEQYNLACNLLMNVYSSVCKVDGVTRKRFVEVMHTAFINNDLEAGLMQLWRPLCGPEFPHLTSLKRAGYHIRTGQQVINDRHRYGSA